MPAPPITTSVSGDCHVDLVPYVHAFGWFERHEIANRAENRFEEVNPRGLTDWMRRQDRLAGGNLRKTIRLLKYLRDYKETFAVPSVILTVIVGGRVSWWRSQLLDGYALPVIVRCHRGHATYQLSGGRDGLPRTRWRRRSRRDGPRARGARPCRSG
jgi:hypothetical protein